MVHFTNILLLVFFLIGTVVYAGDVDDLQLKTTTPSFNLFSFKSNFLALFYKDKDRTQPVKNFTELKAGYYLTSQGVGVLEDIRLDKAYVSHNVQLIIKWRGTQGKIERVNQDQITASLQRGEVFLYWNPSLNFTLGKTVQPGDENSDKAGILVMHGEVVGGQWVMFNFENGWGRQMVLHVKINVLNDKILEDQLRDLSFLASRGRLYAFIQDTCNPLNVYIDEEKGLRLFGEGSLGLKLTCEDKVCSFCMFPVYSSPVIAHFDSYDHQPYPVPEPSTIILVGLGMIGILIITHKKGLP